MDLKVGKRSGAGLVRDKSWSVLNLSESPGSQLTPTQQKLVNDTAIAVSLPTKGDFLGIIASYDLAMASRWQ